jgi:hypothetical protein
MKSKCGFEAKMRPARRPIFPLAEPQKLLDMAIVQHGKSSVRVGRVKSKSKQMAQFVGSIAAAAGRGGISRAAKIQNTQRGLETTREEEL